MLAVAEASNSTPVTGEIKKSSEYSDSSEIRTRVFDIALSCTEDQHGNAYKQIVSLISDQGWEVIRDPHERTKSLNRAEFDRFRKVIYIAEDAGATESLYELTHEFVLGSLFHDAKTRPQESQVEFVCGKMREIVEKDLVLEETLKKVESLRSMRYKVWLAQRTNPEEWRHQAEGLLRISD